METRIPVPTDNIFKFYALFGMVLVVFSLGAVLYNHLATNALILATAVEIDTLKHLEAPTRSETFRLAVLEKQKEVAITDRAALKWPVAGLLAAGVLVAWYGFSKWQKLVQPRIDEMARTELAIAKLQLEKLRRELNVDVMTGEKSNEAAPPV